MGHAKSQHDRTVAVITGAISKGLLHHCAEFWYFWVLPKLMREFSDVATIKSDNRKFVITKEADMADDPAWLARIKDTQTAGMNLQLMGENSCDINDGCKIEDSDDDDNVAYNGDTLALGHVSK